MNRCKRTSLPRRLVGAILALVLLAVWSSPLAAQGDAGSGDLWGLSLRRLEQRLLACQGSAPCSRPWLELDGLTVIDGYVTDDGDGDVILIGRRGDGPPLYVEDFVVALRNAWHRYAERRGGRLVSTAPGCSIDPDPTVMHKLDGVAAQLLSSPGQSDLDEWHRECRRPQKVRVLGIPFHSRFARTMVDADYDMKSLVDGSDSLDLPGFQSLTAMTLDRVRRDIEAGSSPSVPRSSMNRFWFTPGDNLYEEDAGVVWIAQSPVTLLTHPTEVNALNQLTDAAARDPLAERFAADFTTVFDQVAARRPIFRQLEGLFRFVALAKILEHKLRDTPFAATLAYFLDEFPVPHTPVDEELPGRSHAEGLELRRAVPGGIEIVSLRLPSCGGVSIVIAVDAASFHESSDGRLAYVGREARRGKEESDDVSSPIPSIFFVHYRVDKGYELLTHSTVRKLFAWNEVGALLRAAGADSKAKKILLILRGFPAHKADAFRLTCRILQKKLNLETAVHFAEDGTKSPVSHMLKIDGVPDSVREIRCGEGAGWFECSICLVLQVGNKVKEFLLTIRARTREILAEVLMKFLSRNYADDALTEDISREKLILHMLREIQEELGLEADELEFFLKEIDSIGVVELPSSGERRAA